MKGLQPSGSSILLPHTRAPWEIVAFISCFRRINVQFLEGLRQSLSTLVSDGAEKRNNVTQEAVDDFVAGETLLFQMALTYLPRCVPKHRHPITLRPSQS